ncbi:MAG: Rrf2 family transcriptional regulator [Bacteroidota bacterium]
MNSQLTIALHILGFSAARAGDPVTSDELARTYGTSPVVLRRVLSKLRRAGLVETRRGPGGGTVLARPASAITLRDAYDAVADDSHILHRHPSDCQGRAATVLAEYVNGLYADAEQALLERLGATTIDEMDRHVRAAICGSS